MLQLEIIIAEDLTNRYAMNHLYNHVDAKLISRSVSYNDNGGLNN
jgi:hypothetical protein